MGMLRRATLVVAVPAILGLVVVNLRPVTGYVSEVGVPGTWSSVVFRLGVLGVAVALGLLAASLRGAPALVLALAAPFTAVSGAVTCSPGCPLPPHDRPTAADLVHAGAVVAALALCALAMLLLAVLGTDPLLSRISRVGAGLAVPLLGAAGLAMLVVGRGTLTGVLERVALVACLGWLVAASAASPASRVEACPP
jgi:hypothetical protein